MAFIKSPDGISVELLQKGESLAPMEPWVSMDNTAVGKANMLGLDMAANIVGMVGTSFVVGAYVLLQLNKIDAKGLAFNLFNLFGQCFFWLA